MVKTWILLTLLAMPALADDVAGMIIDNIVWTSPGGYTNIRGGTLYSAPPRGGDDWVDGQAICNPNYPFPPGMFSIYIGGGIGVSNQVPSCGALEYWIVGSPVSLRADGNYDHLQWQGAAWYPTGTPATSTWHAACFQFGTDINGISNGIAGEPYIVSHVVGVCVSSTF